MNEVYTPDMTGILGTQSDDGTVLMIQSFPLFMTMGQDDAGAKPGSSAWRFSRYQFAGNIPVADRLNFGWLYFDSMWASVSISARSLVWRKGFV